MVNFEWIDMNDETFKLIEREGTSSSSEVLAVGNKGAILVGRINKHKTERYGYELKAYLGGGFNNVLKFVKIEDLVNIQNTI
jgi:hypothetical protein